VDLICRLAVIYIYVLVVRVFMSWIPPRPGTTYAQIYSVIWNVTEPVLGPVRRALPPMRVGMAAIDLSPIVVIVGGQLLLAWTIC
jgi:YggT family protein